MGRFVFSYHICIIIKLQNLPTLPYSRFYLRGPNFCKFCEVLTSSQILILKQFFSFSFSTVNVLSSYVAIQLFKPHNTCTCPTTVVPLHVQQKDHGDFMCHDDQHFSYYT